MRGRSVNQICSERPRVTRDCDDLKSPSAAADVQPPEAKARIASGTQARACASSSGLVVTRHFVSVKAFGVADVRIRSKTGAR